MKKAAPIFLDNNATTPRDPRVLEEYNRIEKNFFGNSSSNHFFGWQAEEVVLLAREKIAKAVNCSPELIIFTSGASESNNLAIKGFLENSTSMPEIITSKIEHSSIFETVNALKTQHKISYLPNSIDGYVTLDLLSSKENYFLTLHHANNEIGTIQDIESISVNRNAFIHIDCAQSLGKINLDIRKLPAHCISISAHKAYGPVGIGALIFKNQESLIKIKPQILGGSQQAIRSGTLPTALISAFGETCRIAQEDLENNLKHIKNLTKILYSTLTQKCPDILLVGEKNIDKRLAGNLSLLIPNYRANTLISKLSTKIAISKGSACISEINQSSRVLTALGYDDEKASQIIRIGVGKFNTEEEIKSAAELISNCIQRQHD